MTKAERMDRMKDALREAKALIEEAYELHLGSTDEWDERAKAWLESIYAP